LGVAEGHELASFGDLLLQDTFQVLKSDVERDYQVYLFQKIILCCKEAPPTGKQKPNKSNSMIRKSGSGQPGAANGKKAPKPNLQLKGRIFINNISAVTPIIKPSMSIRPFVAVSLS
jgi:cell division control protein 24